MTSLHSRLFTALAPWRSAPAWCVALSGGLDSSVLLQLLVELSRREPLPPLSAIHIHHGLQSAADAWPAHCLALCEQLGVPLQIVHVQVAGGASIERAAREARYAAFVERLGEGEVLLTAQHRDDQAETVLLRLLRGAGVRGLAAMPAARPLGRGQLLRPLLTCSRAELETYARNTGLQWVEDPSNGDIRLSRNYLRRDVMPALSRHWPQAASSLARAAEHQREAQALLDELARQDLATAQTPSPLLWLDIPSLAIAPLAALSPSRQRNALRYWLAELTALPDTDHWAGWEALRDAAEDAQPQWRFGAGELRRTAGRLWWLAGDWLREPSAVGVWQAPAQALALPGNGRLRLAGTLPDGTLEVRYRQGGEVLELPGRGHRDLKRLLNEAAVPAFLRGRLPLLYRADQLLAVANLPALRQSGEGDYRLLWQVPTNDQRLS